MGSSQSSDSSGLDVSRITVVNERPGHESEGDQSIQLPKRKLPILSIEGHNIDPTRHKPEHQINNASWLDFTRTLDGFSHSRAELVATRQSQLQEKIGIVDEHVQRFTDSYIQVSHVTLAKMKNECKRVDDLSKLLQKCTLQSEICVDMLNKLNSLLPQDSRLEPLDVNNDDSPNHNDDK